LIRSELIRKGEGRVVGIIGRGCQGGIQIHKYICVLGEIQIHTYMCMNVYTFLCMLVLKEGVAKENEFRGNSNTYI